MSPESQIPPAGQPAEKPPSVSPAAAPEAEGHLPDAGLITIEEFARLDLRVGRVVTAERHPKADRLLKLQVDLGGETRQLVAGIASCYQPEDLAGRLIVVLANLKPARLRGEISQGMLLAAAWGERISILAPDQELPPGSQIH